MLGRSLALPGILLLAIKTENYVVDIDQEEYTSVWPQCLCRELNSRAFYCILLDLEVEWEGYCVDATNACEIIYSDGETGSTFL